MIGPELLRLLQPLEEFEAIRRRAVRLGDRLCDLSYANPYEGVEERTRALLRQALDGRRLLDLQYTPFGGQTLVRRSVADDLAARDGLPYDFSDVILTPGAMAALQLALRCSCSPGDEVIIPVPCWLDYPLYAHHLGLCPVLVPCPAPLFGLDLEAIAGAITPRTRAVVLSNPSNPVGRRHPEQVLAGLADVLRGAGPGVGRPITFISDETHRDFTEPGTHRPGALAWPATLTIYSFGKYHFLQGQRIGYVAVSPRHPERRALGVELVRWTRVTGLCTPTAHMQAVVPDLLSLRHDLSWLADRRRRVASELSAAGFDVTPPDSTLFVYAAIPAGEEDMAFIRRLAARGVLALPGIVFHHQGYFRLALTGAGSRLEVALAALREVTLR